MGTLCNYRKAYDKSTDNSNVNQQAETFCPYLSGNVLIFFDLNVSAKNIMSVSLRSMNNSLFRKCMFTPYMYFHMLEMKLFLISLAYFFSHTYTFLACVASGISRAIAFVL